MPETSRTSTINLLEVNARAETAQHVITGFARTIPALGDLWQQVSRSLSDTPIVVAEVRRVRGELLTVRLQHANLAAAGRATLAADHDGEPDPLSYLRGELAAQGFGTGRWPA